jgi:hypothetical protein
MDLGILEERAQYRQCLECGAEFETNPSAMALEQFSDHYTMHQPTATQWTMAYRKMQSQRGKNG